MNEKPTLMIFPRYGMAKTTISSRPAATIRVNRMFNLELSSIPKKFRVDKRTIRIKEVKTIGASNSPLK